MLILGKRLYPLIESSHPDLASKITAMLLEIDNSELLYMLESRESLKTKVEEAVALLQAHQAKVVARRNRPDLKVSIYETKNRLEFLWPYINQLFETKFSCL